VAATGFSFRASIVAQLAASASLMVEGLVRTQMQQLEN